MASETGSIERASREGNEKAGRAKRVYISGPMSGHKDLNFAAFNAEAARLRALGYVVSNPAEINPEAAKTWHECLRADIRQLVDCDIVALLPGWERSEGAQLEQHLAHRLGLEVCRAETLTGEGVAGRTLTFREIDLRSAGGPIAAGDVVREMFGAQEPGERIVGLPVGTARFGEVIRIQADQGGGLTFSALRVANMNRVGRFKNTNGEPAHSKPDGSDWTPAQWLQAVVGELGEYANLRKKFERGDIDARTFRREASDELADVATYLDLLAAQLEISLGDAVVSKFNRVSERARAPVFLSLSAGR